MKQPTYGLVLSGGGIRGLAHAGVIKVLEEEGISPTYVSGASAGAIVGALYAAGYGGEDILKFFQETSIFSFRNYAFGKPGLIDTDKFYASFLTYFPEDDFGALGKKLFISTTDILSGKPKTFHEGPLIKAVLASAAFPVVLSPVMIEGVLYADGGITNNFPVEPLLAYCDKVIGVYVSPLGKVSAETLTSSRAVMDRSFKIAMGNMSMRKFHNCDAVIEPENIGDFSTFDTSHLKEAYEMGYQEARKQLELIRSLKEV
ncbi:patatin-like phospholipase family protein [Neolewinella agarilytica]|uniref:patatin-like phospholipase family protein n=1 Tax=Neolewinella agarilytica TaxID=478744 RepID=UPI002355B6F4|nr:patatin-like phospholipase family protein [Neolewinella agarilytica]